MVNLLERWQKLPLYLRTLIGMALGAVVGLWQGPSAEALAKPGSILMGLVQMLAAPVAFFAIVHALAGAKIEKEKHHSSFVCSSPIPSPRLSSA